MKRSNYSNLTFGFSKPLLKVFILSVFMIPTLVRAQYTIYTDRSAWEAALAGSPTSADLSSVTTDVNICSGTVTAGTYSFEPVSCFATLFLTLDVTDDGTFGLLSNTDQIFFQGTGSGRPNVKINIPASYGIGFDWAASALAGNPHNTFGFDFTNSAGTFKLVLNKTATSGFIGIISSCGTISNYNLYSPRTNFQSFSAGSFAHCTTGSTPTPPTTPTLSSTSTQVCGRQAFTLSIASGSLNSSANWVWYATTCGSQPIGQGTSLTLTQTGTTTYYARGEGNCVTGSCGSITINAAGAGTPKSPNIISGNQTISTQTEMDAFFNSIDGTKWTKVAGDLTINGNSTTDPITSLCNLSALSEVTGYLLIQQFTQTGNPTNLNDLESLAKTGRLTIITNPQFQTINLPELTNVSGSLNIRNNRFATSISLPKFSVLEAERLMIIRNPRTQIIQLSNQASSFTFTHPQNNTNVDIQYNGDSASNALTIDLNKITSLGRHLTFINNDNSGVSNFDNIFSGLTTVSGNMTITGNSYLSKCCIAASTAVSGTRTISGNTGNCANLTAVVSDCGTLNKKQSTPGMSFINTDLFANLRIYPSPNKGKFEIEVTTTQVGQLNITVTDLLGRPLLNQSQPVDGTVVIPVNMDKAADGQYIIKLELNENVVIKRVQVIK
jgi:hypothetical protein